jgi:hypothetical protein
VYPDSTNSDPRYIRNRLRLSVFPMLQAINNAAVGNICSVAMIAEAEQDFMGAFARFELMHATVRVVLAAPGAAAAAAAAAAAPADAAAEPGQACVGHDSPQDSSGTPQELQHAHQQSPLQQQQQEQERALVLNTGPAAEGLAAAVAAGVLDGLVGQAYSSQGISRDGGVFGAAAVEGLPSALPGSDKDPSQQQDECGQASAKPSASQQQQQQQLDKQRGKHPQQQRRKKQQPQHAQQACSKPEYHDALRASLLGDMHSAVLRRVIHLWLSAHTSRSVRLSQVQEVEQLLQHKQRRRQSSGAKTSTLWGSSCVMMHRGLLLLLDAQKVAQVSSGELQVQCVQRGPASSKAQDPATMGIAVSIRVGMPISAVLRHMS